jgi:hypothetical protein
MMSATMTSPVVEALAPRYLINADDQTGISRVDKDTACYWWEWRTMGAVGWWQRWKKRYDDVIFDSFDEAKAELVRLLSWRLEQTRAMTSSGFIGARDFRDQPLVGRG